MMFDSRTTGAGLQAVVSFGLKDYEESSPRFHVDILRNGFHFVYQPGIGGVSAVGEQRCVCGAVFMYERGVEVHIQRRVGAVDSGNEPSVAAASCNYCMMSGVARYKARLVPYGGKCSEQILYFGGLCVIAFGFVGKMLHRGFE